MKNHVDGSECKQDAVANTKKRHGGQKSAGGGCYNTNDCAGDGDYSGCNGDYELRDRGFDVGCEVKDAKCNGGNNEYKGGD